MRPTTSSAALLLLVLGCAFAPPAQGQSWPIKTVPDPVGEQFLILPTSNPGIAGLKIMADDQLGDPFTNPALGRGEAAATFYLAPTSYGDHRGTLAGRTIPLGAIFTGPRWFGALALAVQRLESAPNPVFRAPAQLDSAISYEEGRNIYAVAALGRQVGSRTSIGVRVAHGDLELMDGARRLYPESLAVQQSGEVTSLAVGAVHHLGSERTLELVLSGAEVAMDYTVARWRWIPSPSSDMQVPEPWTELNGDRSRIRKARLRYRHPIPGLGIRVGAIGAIHSRRQLGTPGFDLVNVPRDPGNSTIFEAGVGVETTATENLFGAEFTYAPGTAHGRTFAQTPSLTSTGQVRDPDGPTVDHRFRFANWRLDGGMELVQGPITFQLGLGVRRYRSSLVQDDHIHGGAHRERQAWFEWAASTGATVALGPLDIAYSGRLVAKGLAPCPPWSFRNSCLGELETFRDTELMVAPTDAETLPDFQVVTHRIMVSVPIWRGDV